MELLDKVALEDLGLAGLDQPRSDLDCEVNPRSPGSSDNPPEWGVVVSPSPVVAKIMI